MKEYIKPRTEQLRAECERIIAVSLQSGTADPSAEVLTKGDQNWEIWEE